mgnify:CR=1 FL=1
MYNVLSIKNNDALDISEYIYLAKKSGFNSFNIHEEQIDLCKSTWFEIEKIHQLLVVNNFCIPMYKMFLDNNKSDILLLMEKLVVLDVKYLLFDKVCVSEVFAKDISEIVRLANRFNIKVLFENQADLDEITVLKNTFQAEIPFDIGILFNPVNFLQFGFLPLHNAYFPANYKNYIEGILLKDGIVKKTDDKDQTSSEIEETELGFGNAQILELISINKARSYKGMLIFEIDNSGDHENKSKILDSLIDFRKKIGRL